jgi:hypothetical protein
VVEQDHAIQDVITDGLSPSGGLTVVVSKIAVALCMFVILEYLAFCNIYLIKT